MKILCVMPYSPVPPVFGGALREYYLLKNLASEHSVTVLTYGNNEILKLFREEFDDLVDEIHMVQPPWTRRYRRLAQFYTLWNPHSFFYNHNCSQQMQDKIDELLATGSFDAVHCEFSVMGNFDFGNEVIKILDTHNVEYENYRRMWKKTNYSFRRWFYRREYKKVYNEEIRALKDQHVIFSTSKEDQKIFREDIPEVPNYVVPNGVDTSFFIPSVSTKPEPCSLVFTGMMAYTPNYDGMLYFLDEIFPLIEEEIPNVKIYIVGSRPPEELKKRASENVVITGFVDDVRPYVWRSSVFVVPLRMGSGTRLKVVEALAMKKPVVSTRIGCEGIDVEHEKSILIEDSPEAFAKAVIGLFTNFQLRERLTENGYKLVTKNYDWSAIGNRMLQVYRKLDDQKETTESLILQ